MSHGARKGKPENGYNRERAADLIAASEGAQFSREQIAFLEDLLVNKACMVALLKGKKSEDSEECLDCARRVEYVLEVIRGKLTDPSPPPIDRVLSAGSG